MVMKKEGECAEQLRCGGQTTHCCCCCSRRVRLGGPADRTARQACRAGRDGPHHTTGSRHLQHWRTFHLPGPPVRPHMVQYMRKAWEKHNHWAQPTIRPAAAFLGEPARPKVLSDPLFKARGAHINHKWVRIQALLFLSCAA